eukprot:GDKJ01036633.1.p1 GENE.GDKJ01036633.1~~GDKJ01036633.1.p1  ORF type:complete len:116 (+),score=30.70 GDKJ01036633.1:70-417(+)
MASQQQLEQEFARYQQAEEQRQAFEEQKSLVLQACMDGPSRDRLSRIKLVKPDVAGQLEMMIMQIAKSGKLQGKLSETEFISLLQQVTGTTEGEDKRGPRVEITRRRDMWDSDSD